MMSSESSPPAAGRSSSPLRTIRSDCPAALGKAKKSAALARGDLVEHPFRDGRFQPKRQESGRISRVVPRSPLEALFLESSKCYLRWLLKDGCCHPRNKAQGATKCQCLREISVEMIDKLAQIQLNWFTETKKLREVRLIEWIKAAWDKRSCRKRDFKGRERKYEADGRSRWYGKKFVLCQFDEKLDSGEIRYYPYFVCANALLRFYDIKYETWKKLEEIVQKGGDRGPDHLLLGRKSNSRLKKETHDRVIGFLKNLEVNEGEPHATKVIRTRLRVALRNDDDIVELPSSFTKRQLYAKFLFECGWVVKPKGNGSFGPIKHYETRPDSDEWSEAENGRVAPCSFETFRSLWLEKFPKLRIRSPSYDTCSTCFKFSNHLSAIQREANMQSVVLKEIDQFSFCQDCEGTDEVVDNDIVEMSDSSDDDSSQNNEENADDCDVSLPGLADIDDESIEEQTEEEVSDEDQSVTISILNLKV